MKNITGWAPNNLWTSDNFQAFVLLKHDTGKHNVGACNVCKTLYDEYTKKYEKERKKRTRTEYMPVAIKEVKFARVKIEITNAYIN